MDHSLQASKVFDKLATLYQAKYMDVTAYAPELENFIQLLPGKLPAVLEIACGPGNLSKFILERAGSIRLTGIDLAPAMIELSRQNCPTAHFEVMDCRNISQLTQSFDGVIAGFCMPYLSKQEAQQLIADMAGRLVKGGVLFVSTIEGPYSRSGNKKGSTGDEVYMHYYEKELIEEWLSAAGFNILSARKTTNSNNPHQDIELLLLAKKEM